jgi:hypothetical protein
MTEQSANTKKEKKKYNLLDAEYKRTGHVFKGTGPYDAALKAATQGYKEIYLQEVNTRGEGRIHVFQGERILLKEEEMTEHSKRIGAKHKPRVKKMGVIRVGKPKENAPRKPRVPKEPQAPPPEEQVI